MIEYKSSGSFMIQLIRMFLKILKIMPFVCVSVKFVLKVWGGLKVIRLLCVRNTDYFPF